MNNKLIIIFFLIVGSIAAQDSRDSLKMDRLMKIYRNLEYNTTAFDDLKNKWYVTDPVYVREIYNRFIVNNGLTINGVKPSRKTILEKTQDVYNGDVFIELKKRYYDDEIDELRFFSEAKIGILDSNRSKKIVKRDYFFDSIDDYIYIKDLLGETIYNDLKDQFYAYTDLTKKAYAAKQAYNFDIYMHLIEPEVLFWSATTSQKNKYLVSFISRWGNDYIGFPGWYYPDIFPGVKVTYIDYLKNNEPYVTYSLEIGYGVPVRQPQFQFSNDDFGPRLFHSGSNIYFNLYGNPFRLLSEKLEKLEISLSGMFSISTYKTSNFGLNYKSQFYANRNYFSLVAKYKDLFKIMNIGWFYGGLGFSTYDIYHYLLDPKVSVLQEIGSSGANNFEHTLTLEAGMSEYAGLLSHDLSIQFNYNVVKSFGYVGFKAHFLLSNTIGLDFKFFTSLGLISSDLPFYKIDNYIVFSPIIKINY